MRETVGRYLRSLAEKVQPAILDVLMCFILFEVPPSAITVTIGMEWNTDVIVKPIPPPYTTKVASGKTLAEIINKAADENPEGPFNKYSSAYYDGEGHFVTAMNGTQEVCHQWAFTIGYFT